MFPKRGNVLQSPFLADQSPAAFAQAVSVALQAELGSTHRAVKILMRWTAVCEKTAKNWLEGKSGPCGHYLIRLIRNSDRVAELIYAEAGRAVSIEAPRSEEVLPSMTPTESMPSFNRARPARRTASGLLGKEQRAPGVPTNVPINVPGNVPLEFSTMPMLNDRQKWFLAELANRPRLRCSDIAVRWMVATRTAKRDIAGLRARGFISFRGPRKAGAYALNVPTEGDEMQWQIHPWRLP